MLVNSTREVVSRKDAAALIAFKARLAERRPPLSERQWKSVERAAHLTAIRAGLEAAHVLRQNGFEEDTPQFTYVYRVSKNSWFPELGGYDAQSFMERLAQGPFTPRDHANAISRMICETISTRHSWGYRVEPDLATFTVDEVDLCALERAAVEIRFVGMMEAAGLLARRRLFEDVVAADLIEAYAAAQHGRDAPEARKKLLEALNARDGVEGPHRLDRRP